MSEPKDSIVRIKRAIDPAKIVLYQAIFEGYDNLGQLRTVDNKKGIIEILTTVDLKEDCIKLLDLILGPPGTAPPWDRGPDIFVGAMS